MSNQIERVRYFDGEFLRSFDFEAEQNYHVAMRRRLNRSLHLWGIVEGLELTENKDEGFVFISPGMAIDAFGREIFLFAPYTFGDADISGNRISGDGIFDVWIRYKKSAGALPAQGYGSCNGAAENTRWDETFEVVLLPAKTVPFPEPGFEDPDPDDPEQDHVGVLLGSLSVSPGSITAPFANPVFDDRRLFIGVRAQRLRPPLDATQNGTVPYPLLNPNTALTPPLSIGVEANLFAEQNLIVGADFNVDQSKIKPPVTGAYPQPTGNIKVTSDLFVNGNLYWNVNGNWLAFSEYLKRFMPDILQGSLPVVVDNPALPDGVASGTANITVTSTKLTAIGSATAVASISGIQFNDRTDLDTIVKAGDMVQIRINSVAQTTSGNSCTVSVNWSAGPALNKKCAINNFTVSCVVVCFP